MTGFRRPALVLLAGAFTFGGLQAGPKQSVSKRDQTRELLKRVERLEAQVAELKRQREAEAAQRKRDLEDQMADLKREWAQYARSCAETAKVQEELRRAESARIGEQLRRAESPMANEEVQNLLRAIERITGKKELNGQRVPKTWIPREFNGLRYYDIPLNGTCPGR